MDTIQLKIDDKVYDKFIALLGKFKEGEVEILESNSMFLATQNYLKKELKELNSGNSKLLSQEELEKRLSAF
jgi:hypothetical protein